MPFVPTSTLFQKTSDRQIDDLQRQSNDAVSQLQGLVPLNGNYISTLPDLDGIDAPIFFDGNVSIAIPHKLGRPYLGWLLCRFRDPVGPNVPFVYETPNTENDLNSIQVVLTNFTSTSFFADVWVY